MAIYHFSAKVIGRGAGSSALASAAYRAASRLHDERLGRDHDFTNKSGVVHSGVMLPEGAPERLRDREVLWNEVEAGETRKDAQLAREVEFAMPREMNQVDGVALARDFVQREFVDKGMVADLNVHWDIGADGEAKPHAHVMLTMRAVGPDGFGPKVREWNATAQLQQWRENWASHVNARLQSLGIDARIDHRSYLRQGIGLEPQDKIGAVGARRLERGEDAERADEHRAIAARNGAAIIAEPQRGLDAITHQQSTFTVRDMARMAHRHSDGKEQFDQVLAAMRGSDQLVALGRDSRQEERFSTRDMIEVELRLARSAEALERNGHAVNEHVVERALAASETRGLLLSGEQQAALRHVVQAKDLGIVIGYAGSGKSAMLGVARDAWEAAGYTVRGAALSGIAAENLQSGSGISSRTIASLEHAWARDREQLSARDVLVVDEAGMIGSRQMERMLSAAKEAGAKVVLVGDAQQLQAIEAGAAFRALTERHGAREISEIRRQHEGWQRDATRELATGRTGEALSAYSQAGMVRASETREAARNALIKEWSAERAAAPDKSRTILAHTRDDVRALNDMARGALKGQGELVGEVSVETGRGERSIAPGERIIFLRNERELGVKNGTRAIVEQATPERIAVRLDDGRQVSFDTKSYADIDHGYATTIHKAQGITVGCAHVLATPGMDQHMSYVAMSRHREQVSLHYGRDDFDSPQRLATALGRDRAKDITLDYPVAREQFAEQRGFGRIVERIGETAREVADKAASVRRSIFDGLKLDPQREASGANRRQQQSEAEKPPPRAAEPRAPSREEGSLADRLRAMARDRADDQDRTELLRQMVTERSAAEKAEGRPAEPAIEVAARAGRFVEQWRELSVAKDIAGSAGRDGAALNMRAMTNGLETDHKLGSALADRRHELGLGPSRGASLDPTGRTGAALDMIEKMRSAGIQAELVQSQGLGLQRGADRYRDDGLSL
jgi:Ti-type conjugative transfer relaxase TraA